MLLELLVVAYWKKKAGLLLFLKEIVARFVSSHFFNKKRKVFRFVASYFFEKKKKRCHYPVKIVQIVGMYFFLSYLLMESFCLYLKEMESPCLASFAFAHKFVKHFCSVEKYIKLQMSRKQDIKIHEKT